MSLLGWLFNRTRFIRFDDSYALKRESLWQPLCDSISRELSSGRQVFAIACFTDVYGDLQKALEERGIEYEVITQMLDTRKVEDLVARPSSGVRLIHESLLPEIGLHGEHSVHESETRTATGDAKEATGKTLSVFVCDRHPLPEPNQRIEKFWKQAPFKIYFGAFLALDDVVVHNAIGDTTVELLEQLGLGRHEPVVASLVVSRRIRKFEKKVAGIVKKPVEAMTAAEWYQVNWNKK